MAALLTGTAIGATVGFIAGSVHAPPAPNGPVYVYEGRRHAPFYGGVYVWPAGYSYRELDQGAVLPAAFATSAYFIDNYSYYGLAAPPPNYRWVRYGADLVLINLANDAVIDVVRGVFVPGAPRILVATTAPGGVGWYDPEELPGDLPPPGVMP